MTKALYIALLAAGVVLLAFGFDAQNSLVSTGKEAITGTPTDRSMVLIVAGLGALIIGVLGAMFHRGNN